MNQRSSSFFSEALQQAIDDNKHIIENYAEIRNQISNDIKGLESYLDANVPKDEFLYRIGGYPIVGEPELSKIVAGSWQYHDRLQDEIIAWKPDHKGRFRLFLDIIEWDAFMQVGKPNGPYYQNEDSITVVSKPMIEWPFDVRREFHPWLPMFVTALSKHLASEAGIADPSQIEGSIF